MFKKLKCSSKVLYFYVLLQNKDKIAFKNSILPWFIYPKKQEKNFFKENLTTKMKF
jgi:hypothetical protein